MASLTIEQIAELAHVSIATVSRVLNNQPHVRTEVRERVLAVMQEHHYTPHAAARTLAGQRPKVIAVFISRTTATIFRNPTFSHLLQGMTEACNAKGYVLMVSLDSANRADDPATKLLNGRSVDGRIVIPNTINDPLLPQLIADRVPMVLVGKHPLLHHIVSVDIDHFAGSYQAVHHLLKLGHQSVGMIVGSLHALATHDQIEGYQQAYREAGLPIHPALIATGNETEQGGQAAIEQLLALQPRPSALFVSSAVMATGVLQTLHTQGLRVPDDITVVCFDDVPTAASLNPSMTSLHQPMYDLGATAANVLIDMIEGKTPSSENTILPISMIVRHENEVWGG
ncbi:MAG: LacI family transcriptional regulator [Chloroflexi bacterium]|nr:LacI family transcriptional regulator [Chloroflexota bacterium]